MRVVRKGEAAVVLTLFFVFSVGTAWAQAPRNLSEIPVFKGAVLVSEEEAPAEEGLRSGIRRTYTVCASPEEVLAFYENAVHVKGRFLDVEDENLLEVGKATTPYCQVYFWDESGLVDEDAKFGASTRRAWIKKALQGRRKDKEGAWVQDANIEWRFRDTESSMTRLTVMLQDLSVDEDARTYEVKTEIVIDVVNYDYEI